MTLVLSSRFTNPNTRRRAAIRAAHEIDEDALIELLNTHLTEGGRRREKTSAQTRKTYAKAVRKFLEYCQDGQNRLEIRSAKSAEINSWLDLLRRHGLRGSTTSTYLSGVRALYSALEWAEAVDRNPAVNARAIRDETPGYERKRPLTREERAQLIELPNQRFSEDDPRSARDTAILTLGSRAGLRAGDLMALNIDDIDPKSKTILIARGKGGKSRLVPITKGSLAILTEWMQIRETLNITETSVFTSLSRRSFGHRLSYPGLLELVNGYIKLLFPATPDETVDVYRRRTSRVTGTHTLRRTAGTRLYERTKDLRTIADIFGHSSVATAGIYARATEELNRAAVEADSD
jgi:integrase/recombinase XerC